MKRILLIITLALVCTSAWAEDLVPAIGHDQALAALRGGNARFVAGQPQAWCAGQEKRDALSNGQHPSACIITCSDSRVSPEILFDQTLGQIFVVRLAGNVVTPEAVGSVEYAVEHLHVPLVVVLGHSSCGAVAAALKDPDMTGPIGTLVSRIKPAVEIAKLKGFTGDELSAAVVSENARRGAQTMLECSRAIDEAVNSGELTVLSAVYDLKSGQVAWQTQLSAPAKETAPVAVAPAAPTPEKTVASSEQKATDKPAAAVTPKKKKDKEPSFYAGRH
jgi:carbonic anhydrase